jgi:glucose/arabinose dehydrogenase
MPNRSGAISKGQVLLLLWLLFAAGCSSTSSGAATEPTYPAAPLDATPALTPTTALTTPAGRLAAKPRRTPIPVVPGTPVSLRSDIKIRKLLETGGGFVRLKLDPSTKTIYYMDAKVNIYRLSIQPGAGSKGDLVYTQNDLGVDPKWVTSGMAFGKDGTLYVLGNIGEETLTHAVIRKGVPEALGKRIWTTLASTEPYPKSNTQFDHIFNGIVVSPDGKYIYINSGSRTDHGEVQAAKGAFPDTREVPLTAGIFRIPTNADDQLLPNDYQQLKAKGYEFARGTRNSYDPAFAPNGDLIAGDNGPDADYPDELNWLREGRHYGFPWRLGNVDNPQRFANYDSSKDGRLQPDFFAVKSGFYQNDLTYPPAPEGVAFTDPIANLGPDGAETREADGSEKYLGDLGEPAYTFTPHRSPLGLVFDAAGAVGGDLRGDAFILSWGAAAGNLADQGRDLLDLKLAKAGDNYQAKMTQLVVGFDYPVDGALLGNKIYVLDYGGKGSIWEVTLP